MSEYFKTDLGKILLGDVRETLFDISNDSVDLCITSPPYFRQRNYGNDSQIGWEESEEIYIEEMAKIFAFIKNQLLKPTGCLFLNVGDKYNDDKSMSMIPAKLAIRMMKDGWILRNELIWKKSTFLPTKTEDRFIYAHEHVFFFTKEKRDYYFNKLTKTDYSNKYRGSVWDIPINSTKDIEGHYAPFSTEFVEAVLDWACPKQICGECGKPYMPVFDKEKIAVKTSDKESKMVKAVDYRPLGKTSMFKNKGSVTKRTLKAMEKSCGCLHSKADVATVLDTFSGSGTVADICESKGIKWIGCELNPEFAELGKNRILSHKNGISIPKIEGKNGGLLNWQDLKLRTK